MKKISIIMVAGLFSFSALAEVIRPETVECRRLKDLVQDEGVVKMRLRSLFGIRYTQRVQSIPKCADEFELFNVIVRSLDERRCFVGYMCKSMPDQTERNPRRCEVIDC